MLAERELKRLTDRQRWSRREETDFYRTLISYGVEQDVNTGDYVWSRFKQLARLDIKYDNTLTDYYTAFIAMCKRVCKRPLTRVRFFSCVASTTIDITTQEEECLASIPEPVSEERANKVLSRVEFMSRVRSALKHPHLDERIELCTQRTPDFPPWWQCGGRHDLDLLKVEFTSFKAQHKQINRVSPSTASPSPKKRSSMIQNSPSRSP